MFFFCFFTSLDIKWFSFVQRVSVSPVLLLQLSAGCVICAISPSLFTTQQVSKCLFDFKGFLCFM